MRPSVSVFDLTEMGSTCPYGGSSQIPAAILAPPLAPPRDESPWSKSACWTADRTSARASVSSRRGDGCIRHCVHKLRISPGADGPAHAHSVEAVDHRREVAIAAVIAHKDVDDCAAPFDVLGWKRIRLQELPYLEPASRGEHHARWGVPTQQVIGLPKPMFDIGTKDRARHGFQLPNLLRHASSGCRPCCRAVLKLLQCGDALCNRVASLMKSGCVLLRQRLRTGRGHRPASSRWIWFTCTPAEPGGSRACEQGPN